MYGAAYTVYLRRSVLRPAAARTESTYRRNRNVALNQPTNQPGQRSQAIRLMTAPLIASHPTLDNRSINQPTNPGTDHKPSNT